MRTTRLLCLMFALGLASAGLKADGTAPAMVSTTAAAAAPAMVSRTAAPAAPLMVSTTVSTVPSAMVPTVAPTMVPTMVPGAAITVTLKDGQRTDLFLKSYDNFFLSASNSAGTRFDIPWSDVAAVDSAQDGSDLAMMRGKITDDSATVDIEVEPRSPHVAFMRALWWPGILIHGSGFDYVGDKEAYTDLAGAEVFGVAVAAMGAYLDVYPNTEDTGRDKPTVPQDMIIGGAAIFGVTWLWDICFSPRAAGALDQSKGLAFTPSPGGAQVAYRF